MTDRHRPHATAGTAMVVVLCTASFLAVVDTTIVSIALPSIRGSLQLSAGAAQWVLSAYALVFGGVLLLAGRLADRYGRRRAFLAGLVLFAAGSALAGGAVNGAVLLVGRVVQALGAAAFVPSSLSLLTTSLPDRAERNRALGAYGAMAGLGFVAGMLGGGVITELWGWRWIFLLNLPVVAGTLLLAVRVLSESRDRRASGPLDVGGAATVTAGLVLVIVALAAAPQHGWTSPRTWVPALAGVAALTAFAVVERRHRAPLVPPALVGRPAVLVPNGAVAVQSMIGIAWLFLLTLYFQDVQGRDPLATGLLFAPMTAASLIGAWVAGRLATAVGVRRTALTGILLVAAGLVAMGSGVTAGSALGVVIAGMVIGEAGFMLASVALTIAATGSLDDEHSGLAAGLINTASQLGAGIGLGVVATVVVATAPAGTTAAAVRNGFLTCLVFSVLAATLVAAGLRSEQPVRRRRSALTASSSADTPDR